MRRPHLLPPSRRTVRIALGVIWLIDAALQAQSALFTSDWWQTDLAGSVMGEPAAVRHSILWAVGIIAAHAAIWNGLFVAVQAAIGLALITGRFDQLAIVASIPWALGIWWVGEGFGMLPTGFALAAAGAPGPVLLYPLLGIIAWPTRDGDAPIARRLALGAWAILWAGTAVLQLPLVYAVRQSLVANVQELSQGLPSWQESVAAWTTSLVQAHPVAVSVIMAVAQILTGLFVLTRWGRRPAVLAGIAVSLFYWVCFQYLGGILGGGVVDSGATDPSAAPLVVLLAVALWPAVRPLPLEVPQLAVADEVHVGPGGQHPQGVRGHGQVVVGHARRPIGDHRPQLGGVQSRSQDHLGHARLQAGQQLIEGGGRAAAAGDPDQVVGRHDVLFGRQLAEGEAEAGLVARVR